MINIRNPQDCCGCEACVAVCHQQCISMQENGEGFLYPLVDVSKCIQCGLCNKVCPWEDIPKIPDCLPEPLVYAGWNLDEEVRRQSSSGGVFTVLAEHILKQGGIVVGASFVQNCTKVEHVVVDSLEELPRLRKSKYVQSSIPLAVYHTIKKRLLSGNKVLFTGTPCQVAALRNFFSKKDENLYTCDLICFGIPSPGWYRRYVEKLCQREKENLVAINMRSKHDGWKKYGVCEEYETKTKFFNLHQSIWSHSFLKKCTHRYSCFECKYARLEREGDITLGDFWGVKDKYPQYDEDDKGTSLLLVNSTKGETLLNECSKNLFLGKADLEHALIRNQKLLKSSPVPDERKSFLYDSTNLSLEELKKKYNLYQDFLLKKTLRKIFIGIPRKILRIFKNRGN
ncbi:MAG: 4Fe-4S dicluster domain-containing protein [Clostridia bacterium]|nr:4Fe-4S dicluster domain-containing protein [Clostridia bacterium]